MNTDEKEMARIFFKNKVSQADGQKFEDIFTQIMNYLEQDFQQVKPWGTQGDRGNDGCIPDKGIYYQVFAPEDIRKSHDQTVKKLKGDFAKLLEHWQPINEFYFVVNDKYDGVSPDCLQAMTDIKQKHNLQKAQVLTAKDLENMLFQLEDDKVISIVGFLPDPSTMKNLDYSILNEVIGHIMDLPSLSAEQANIELPDWDQKIQFNHLSNHVKSLLEAAYIYVSSLEEYLKNESNFLADELRNRINELYIQKKSQNQDGDILFFEIMNSAIPKQKKSYSDAAFVIMAKYFEACDIFEKPKES